MEDVNQYYIIYCILPKLILQTRQFACCGKSVALRSNLDTDTGWVFTRINIGPLPGNRWISLGDNEDIVMNYRGFASKINYDSPLERPFFHPPLKGRF